MFALILSMAITTSEIDRSCQEKFGHPGDLGVTAQAVEHFSRDTTYVEAAATIGEFGRELPSQDAGTKVFRWQNGKLEMHFRGERLARYQWNGQWNELVDRHETSRSFLSAPAQPSRIVAATTLDDDNDKRREFEEFERQVWQIVKAGNQVARENLERNDLQALRYYLPKLKQAISANNWELASEIRDRMSVTLRRSQLVAEDAPRRLNERKRRDEERRHREEMEQRERQHREQLQQQQAILNQMRLRNGY